MLLVLAVSPTVSPTLDREGVLGTGSWWLWGQCGGPGDSVVALGTGCHAQEGAGGLRGWILGF